jgi:hypothetical protein
MAEIVKETSEGLNIALFLISITSTRFDEADTNAIQIIGKLLSNHGIPHIYLIFTQVDRLATEEAKKDAIDKWTQGSFEILEKNEVYLCRENFYVLRSGQETKFIDWL